MPLARIAQPISDRSLLDAKTLKHWYDVRLRSWAEAQRDEALDLYFSLSLSRYDSLCDSPDVLHDSSHSKVATIIAYLIVCSCLRDVSPQQYEVQRIPWRSG